MLDNFAGLRLEWSSNFVAMVGWYKGVTHPT